MHKFTIIHTNNQLVSGKRNQGSQL